MSTFRFIGSHTEIGSIAVEDSALKIFGQSIDLPDDLARDVMLGGGAILPEVVFDDLGFTEQELSIYADPFSHGLALPAFLDKKKKALVAYSDLVKELANA